MPTTGISLVREHTQQMQLPRFLWVPFELGRPFGAPNEPDFQRRVLRSALELLERDDGPVVLADFADDAPTHAPREEEEAGWACPTTTTSWSTPSIRSSWPAGGEPVSWRYGCGPPTSRAEARGCVLP